MNQKLFSKDFTLVVIGQIISLFGNATIRFALPLYLLNLTGSSALYGTVTACAFIWFCRGSIGSRRAGRGIGAGIFANKLAIYKLGNLVIAFPRPANRVTHNSMR